MDFFISQQLCEIDKFLGINLTRNLKDLYKLPNFNKKVIKGASMEINTMFLDWQSQHCKDVSSPQIAHMFDAILIKILVSFFHGT